jgi:outer membrane immunogenic protein
MKRFLLAGVGLFALTLAVQPSAAADLPRAPVVKAPAAVTAPMFNWSGCYLGAHAGGLWGSTKHDLTPTVAQYEIEVDFSGITAGGHLGCNYQVRQFVFGLEGDLNWAGIDDRAQIVPFDQFYSTSFDWYATLRGRAGFATERWHIYGTAGIAFSDIGIGFSGLPGPFSYQTASKRGWVAGGGVEYAIAPDWVARFEYLYHRFREGTIISDGGDFRHDGRPDFHVLRVGLSYKFSSGKAPVPVVTKY